jgi:ABC-type multidrug transport system ATPase subunit
MKNELILARFTGRPTRSAAERLQQLLEEFGLQELQAKRFGHLALQRG